MPASLHVCLLVMFKVKQSGDAPDFVVLQLKFAALSLTFSRQSVSRRTVYLSFINILCANAHGLVQIIRLIIIVE